MNRRERLRLLKYLVIAVVVMVAAFAIAGWHDGQSVQTIFGAIGIWLFLAFVVALVAFAILANTAPPDDDGR